MKWWNRILMLLKVKSSAALDRAEDPREVLDYAYQQQQELLRKVRVGLVEVATTKHQLAHEVGRLRSKLPQTEAQARQAMGQGREDLARLALQRKQTALSEIESLERQVLEVANEERTLTKAEHQLSTRVEEFRTRRQAAMARYTAAEAQVRVGEAITGISGELADLSMALGRAEEKTRRMQARASALGSLFAISPLALPVGDSDALTSELRLLEASRAIDEDLDGMKRELGLLPPPPTTAGGDQ